jgi:hypothetical protein
VALRAFPVLYARDVAAVAAFYARLGVEEHVRLPAPDGSAGFVGVLREPADTPWGERVGFVADPEGNVVSLAAPVGSA